MQAQTQFILLTLTSFYSILKNKRYKTGGRSMGRVFKFHNDVDTDQIIASQYLLLPNIEEMCADSWKWQSMNPNGYRD